jgi:hypothetical protein
MGAEIVQQRTGDRRLANATFVRTDEDNGWLAYASFPTTGPDTRSSHDNVANFERECRHRSGSMATSRTNHPLHHARPDKRA